VLPPGDSPASRASLECLWGVCWYHSLAIAALGVDGQTIPSSVIQSGVTLLHTPLILGFHLQMSAQIGTALPRKVGPTTTMPWSG
jgi:hypothetical protein